MCEGGTGGPGPPGGGVAGAELPQRGQPATVLRAQGEASPLADILLKIVYELTESVHSRPVYNYPALFGTRRPRR